MHVGSNDLFQRGDGLGRLMRERNALEGLPAAVAALPAARAVGGAVSAAKSALSSVGRAVGFAPNLDPDRLRDNKKYFERAMQGDRVALEYLKFRSGHFGKGMVQGKKVGVLATATARDDAWKKYQQVMQAMPELASQPIPDRGSLIPGVPALAGIDPVMLLAGGVAAWFLFRRRGRR